MTPLLYLRQPRDMSPSLRVNCHRNVIVTPIAQDALARC